MRINLLLLVFHFVILTYGQLTPKGYSYYEREYSTSNDSYSIIESLNKSIIEAQGTNNYHHLTYVYEDASVYSTNLRSKLKFASKSVQSAEYSGDHRLQASARLSRAIIYYRDFGDLAKSMGDLLRADEALRTSGTPDKYLYHKIRYHIALLNQHLGYYQEAIDLFTAAGAFFKTQLESPNYFSELENYRKAYLNAQYQLGVCHSKLKDFPKSFANLKKGLVYLSDSTSDNFERARYFELLGVNYLNLNAHATSLQYLSKSYSTYKSIDNIKGIASTSYYLGRYYLSRKNPTAALEKFKETDAIFKKHRLVIEEIALAYDKLLEYPDLSIDEKNSYLARKIQINNLLHKSDNKISKLVSVNFQDHKSDNRDIDLYIHSSKEYLVLFLVALALMRWNYKLEGYKLSATFLSKKEQGYKIPKTDWSSKNKVSQELVNEILLKLADFEKSRGYLCRDICLKKMAIQFESNTSHVSYVINSQKQVNFSTYISQLRIGYITNLLKTEGKYRKYTVEALSAECGIISRQSFSRQFQVVNNMTPYEYIQKITSE